MLQDHSIRSVLLAGPGIGFGPFEIKAPARLFRSQVSRATPRARHAGSWAAEVVLDGRISAWTKGVPCHCSSGRPRWT